MNRPTRRRLPTRPSAQTPLHHRMVVGGALLTISLRFVRVLGSPLGESVEERAATLLRSKPRRLCADHDQRCGGS